MQESDGSTNDEATLISRKLKQMMKNKGKFQTPLDIKILDLKRTTRRKAIRSFALSAESLDI